MLFLADISMPRRVANLGSVLQLRLNRLLAGNVTDALSQDGPKTPAQAIERLGRAVSKRPEVQREVFLHPETSAA